MRDVELAEPGEGHVAAALQRVLDGLENGVDGVGASFLPRLVLLAIWSTNSDFVTGLLLVRVLVFEASSEAAAAQCAQRTGR